MTSIETGPSWSVRWNPRNWPLAWKLVVVGLVPALLALTFGVLRVSDQASTASELRRSSRLLEVREQVAQAADALRRERDQAALFVVGSRTGDRAALQVGFSQSDTEIGELRAAAGRSTGLDFTATATLGQTESGFTQLASIRTDATVDVDSATVDTATADPSSTDQIVSRYSDVIERVDALERALLRQLRFPELAGFADALATFTNAAEQLALQHTVLGAAIRAGQLRPTDVATVSATDSGFAASFSAYQVALMPGEVLRYGDFVADGANIAREQLKATILATPQNRPITVAPTLWDDAYQASLGVVGRARDGVLAELTAGSMAAVERATNLAGINSVILMLGLLLGVTIAVLVLRALIRSLRVLRTTALDVAERRLPQAVERLRSGETTDVTTVDPVPLTTRDEVGQVARAFDAVHGQAVRLAADQAALQAGVSAMFVNLSRRSQALVERQLKLIEQLESNEEDPDQLSNLFQLDHLATRMRRNSENLLVLAGTDLAKRNIAPVPMVDVLRAAVSEVEQYQRIVVQAPPAVTIVGRAASDVVHLLAELLDNATTFSPPDSQVVIGTTRSGDGSIVVDIVDCGVGMTDQELSEANQRLGGPSSVDVSASRRMGLFVVGRLGARHGVGVRLSTSTADDPGAGLTASVTVPAYLIPSNETAADRPVEVPLTVAVPGDAAPTPGTATHHAGTNGNGQLSSLPALVTGSDGPGHRVGVFDPPAGDASAGGLFAAPPMNGTPPGLPSRRPGSSLRPDVPARSPADHPDQGETGYLAEPMDRDVAEQARRDQETADQLARDQLARDQKARDQLARDQKARDQLARERATHAQAAPLEGNEDERPGGDHPGVAGAPEATIERDVVARPNGSSPNGTAPQSSTAPNGTAPAQPAKPPATQDRWRPGPDVAQRPERSAVEHRVQPSWQRTDQQRREGPTARPDQSSPADQSFPAAEFLPTATDATDATDAAFGSGAPRYRGSTVHEHAQPLSPTLPSAIPPPVGASRPDGPSTPQLPLEVDPQQAGQDRAPFSPDTDQAVAQRLDPLFAPSIATIGEFDTGRPGDEPGETGFDRGETTPIFQEIASAWFRSNRPVPVAWETEQNETDRTPKPSTAGPARSVPATVSAPAEATARPAAPVGVTAAAPVPVAASDSDPSFASVADDGWRAANGIAADRPDELTAAGLPKRRPRARLVPGSAGSAVLPPPVSAPRSADMVRGRLASYQQGVRHGRESRLRDGDTAASGAPSDMKPSDTKPAAADGHHDEEST